MIKYANAFGAVGIAVAATTIFPSGALMAQSFVAAPGQKQEIDLDTADGAASSWQHKDLRSLSAMKATIKVPRLGKDPTYTPYFTVWLDAGGGGSYGLHLQPVAGAPRLQLQAYYRNPQKSDIVVSTFKRTLALDEQLNVEFTWKGSKLFIRVADEKSEMPLPAPVNFVGIAGQTGEIKADIALGNMR